MAIGARIGHGTLLAYEAVPGSGNYTTLAGRTNIGGPSLSRDTPDSTDMDSPNQWREFIAGLKDGGEITLEAQHLPNNATQDASSGALALFISGQLTNWRLTFPVTPAVNWILPSIMSNYEPEVPVEDIMMLSVTLKVSGEPTLA